MIKKLVSALLAALLVCGLFAACNRSNNPDTESGTGGSAAKVKEIRYLNFKPEIAEVYDRIAAAYEKSSGVKLIVETAASGTYESTLTARMATKEAPTLFQINGPIGYSSWKEYCADLKGTELYKHLKDKSLAVTSGDGVYGIPYVVEGYGIIYNKKITDAYFALSNRATDFKSIDDIKSFDSFKKLVEDMQAHKEELGIQGVFAATSLKTGEDWRWQTHLMNIPVTLEFKKNGVDLTGDGYKKIDFIYSDNFKIFLTSISIIPPPTKNSSALST